MKEIPRVMLIIPVSVYNGEVAIGPLYASSALKRAGINVEVFFVNFLYRTSWKKNAYELIFYELDLKIQEFSPQVIAFSVFATNFDFVIEASKHIKQRFSTPILVGGIQAIVEEKEMFSQGPFDAACVGEAEDSIADVVRELLDGGNATSSFPDFIFRDGGESAPRIGYRNLDDYAFPDRECLSKYYGNGLLNEANFITGRGCPYNCHYCHAKLLNSKHGYLRYRSPENVIEEIYEVKKRYNIQRAVFSDETFAMNKKHLFRTLELYRKRIALPFICQTRVETLDGEVADELKGSGCEHVTMGIESGSCRIRSEHLNRKMNNENIVEAFNILKKHFIRKASFNMIGLPDERISDVWKTIELNRKAEVDDAYCTVFMPFRRTEIYKYYEENGLIKSSPNLDYYRNVTIRHPYLSKLSLMMFSSNLVALISHPIPKWWVWFSPSCWMRLFMRFYFMPFAMSFAPWALSLFLNMSRYVRFKRLLARVMP